MQEVWKGRSGKGRGGKGTREGVATGGPPPNPHPLMNCPQMCLKCADLGHLASAQQVHMQWVHRLESEVRIHSRDVPPIIGGGRLPSCWWCLTSQADCMIRLS